MIDLDELDYVRARWQRRRTWPVTSICIHTIENAETPLGAENCARYFRDIERVAGAHFCIDNDSIVMCADPRTMTIPHCYGPSAWSVGLEHAGTARQTDRDWHDTYSLAELALSADLSATLCQTFNIPVVKLTPSQVKLGMPGIFGHYDATLAVNKIGGHTDPGAGFPWGEYLDMVRARLMPPKPPPPIVEGDDEMLVPFRKPIVPDGVVPRADGRWPQYLIDDHARVVHGYNGLAFSGAPQQATPFGTMIVDLSAATPTFTAAQVMADGRLVLSGEGGNTYTLGFIF